MTRRKLSKADYASLNKGRPVRSYPPGGGPARITVQGPPKPRRKGNR